MTSSHQNNASDPVNVALNYAYGVLEGEVRRAVNAVGLEPSVGFLHEFAEYQTKQSLVYDLMEPFRWLADFAVIKAFESGVLDLPDFYFTGDDYRYRLEPDAKGRLIRLLREQFNSGVPYKGRVMRWDTVVEQKALELGRYLIGRSSIVDFSNPSPVTKRQDGRELRTRILALTPSEARTLGIAKSTLHYMKKKAQGGSSFQIQAKTMAKIAEV